MPTLQLGRYETILPREIAAVVARTKLSDVTDTSTVKHVLAATAREMDDGYYQLGRLAELFDIDRASGSDLDERAREVLPPGAQRLGARRATGSFVFARVAATAFPVPLPIGTIVEAADGSGVAAQTIAFAQIPANGLVSVSVPAVALEPGAAGNIASGVLRNFRGRPPGVDAVTNNVQFTFGRDVELDDAFRKRIHDFVAALARCDVRAIEFAAIGLEDPDTQRQVVFAHVYEDPVELGRVTLYVDDGGGSIESSRAAAPSGIGSAITAPVSNAQTLTDPAGVFSSELVGRAITLAGGNVLNQGTFPIIAIPSATQVTYTNAAGVLDSAYTGAWSTSPEVVMAEALGGEEYLLLVHKPVRLESPMIIYRTRGGVTVALAGGIDYLVNPANGRLYFTTPLRAGDRIEASYRHFTELIAFIQKVIDGDPNDRLTFPGWRAGGILVRVQSPSVRQQVVEGVLSILSGFDRQIVIQQVRDVVTTHINTLGISGDIVRNALIERIMEVPGVYDVELRAPANNLVTGDDQIARAIDSNVDFS